MMMSNFNMMGNNNILLSNDNMRNHGIDLLKIYAMFLIVALHYSNFGFKIGTIQSIDGL